MAKARILGPRERLEEVLDAVQDLEVVHLSRPYPTGPLRPFVPSERRVREERQLRTAVEDIDGALARLEPLPARPPSPPRVPSVEELARWARAGRRVRRELESLDRERLRLETERASIDRYREAFAAFESLLPAGWNGSGFEVYPLVLRSSAERAGESLRRGLQLALGPRFQLLSEPLESGDLALVLVVPKEEADRVEGIIREADIEEVPIPEGYAERTPREAIHAMQARLREIDRRLQALEDRRGRLRVANATELLRGRNAIRDRLLELQALGQALATERVFVLEGWLPAAVVGRLGRSLTRRFGTTVVVETVSTEEWAGEEAPVVLSNPRLFRPFEAITNMFPLPHYGTIDPTPFVAVFFPMFFGIVLGDVGYGLFLGLLAGVLHVRTRPGRMARSIAEIAGACAAFTVVFGFLYGELFGDLGRQWLNLRPLAFDRREALVPFLGLTLALGTVHVLLGLVLGVISTLRTDPRRSLGRGISALMVLLVLVGILAATHVLPDVFFTPTIVALLVALPVLVVAEGIVAPVELLSTLGNILSYGRIMALGTASVVMAVVANRMVGTMGSAAVGILFALLFHLVNFGLGVFGPTIHALRLHYVEFFGKFYSPGGTQYRPLGHWRPERTHPT